MQITCMCHVDFISNNNQMITVRQIMLIALIRQLFINHTVHLFLSPSSSERLLVVFSVLWIGSVLTCNMHIAILLMIERLFREAMQTASFNARKLQAISRGIQVHV